MKVFGMTIADNFHTTAWVDDVGKTQVWQVRVFTLQVQPASYLLRTVLFVVRARIDKVNDILYIQSKPLDVPK